MKAIRQHGYAWLAMAGALGLHVADEAANDFLSVYNPTVRDVRAAAPWLPLPTFEYRVWLWGLIGAVVALAALSWFVFRGRPWTAAASYVLAGFMILNGGMHFAGSIWMRREMPGVVSSPVLILAGIYLVIKAQAAAQASRPI